MTVLDRITGLTDSNSRGAVFPEKWVPQILEVQQAQEAFNRCFLRLRRTDSRIGVTHWRDQPGITAVFTRIWVSNSLFVIGLVGGEYWLDTLLHRQLSLYIY